MSDQERQRSRSSGIDLTRLARCIELRLPSDEATDEMVAELCCTGIKYNLRAVSVPISQVTNALRSVRGTGVAVSALIGAPTGVLSGEFKVQEALQTIRRGAHQITILLDAQNFRERWGRSTDECENLNKLVRVCRACNPAIVLKVLLDVTVLTESEYRAALGRLGEIDVDFVGVVGEVCVEWIGIDPVASVQAVLGGRRKTFVWNALFDSAERTCAETAELNALRVSALEDLIRTSPNKDGILLSTINGAVLMETAAMLYALDE